MLKAILPSKYVAKAIVIPDTLFRSTDCYHVCQLLGKVDGMDQCTVSNILNEVEAGNRIGWEDD